jgi:hypothetical protein
MVLSTSNTCSSDSWTGFNGLRSAPEGLGALERSYTWRACSVTSSGATHVSITEVGLSAWTLSGVVREVPESDATGFLRTARSALTGARRAGLTRPEADSASAEAGARSETFAVSASEGRSIPGRARSSTGSAARRGGADGRREDEAAEA